MISETRYTRSLRLLALATSALLTAACGSSGSSGSPGTSMTLNALVAPSAPGIVSIPNPGEKQFSNTAGDTITLTRAYLTISSTEIVEDCTDVSFSAMLQRAFDALVPTAHAHTDTTPTSTGVPYIIDLLAADGIPVSLGELSPPPGDYCGAKYDLTAADNDAINLPSAVDMIGKTVHIEGRYSDSTSSGTFAVTTGITLIQRKLVYPAIVSLDAGNLDGNGNVSIHYDTWFNGVNLHLLANGTPAEVNSQTNQVLINITDSLHQ